MHVLVITTNLASAREAEQQIPPLASVSIALSLENALQRKEAHFDAIMVDLSLTGDIDGVLSLFLLRQAFTARNYAVVGCLERDHPCWKYFERLTEPVVSLNGVKILFRVRLFGQRDWIGALQTLLKDE